MRAGKFLEGRWRGLWGLSFAALLLWMGLAWLALKCGDEAPALELLMDASYAAAGLFGVLFALAAAFRYGGVRRPLLGAFADRALPVYLLHYAPVVWIQYGLTGLALPAVAKGAIVFVGAVAISCGVAAAWSLVARMLVGSERATLISPARALLPLASPGDPLPVPLSGGKRDGGEN